MGGGKRPLDPSKLSPTLAENSWATIARASAEGIASQVWSIGDGIDIVLAGDYSGSVTMQIAGFDHDSLAEGGRAGITFLSKQLVAGGVFYDYSTLGGGWRDSTIRSNMMPKVYGSLPEEVREAIRTAIKTTSCQSYGLLTTEDDVFIPSLPEVFALDDSVFTDTYGRPLNTENDGTRYDIFKNSDDARRKGLISGGAGDWWTRSSGRESGSSSTNTCAGFVKIDGSSSGGGIQSSSKCICFGFCV